eukprot:CAMPEP_0172668894 /NCGR_PEP_ID=MMETSP1074-20121228/9342_1 /TAXON_ID=2916 /ORGANISM="Ceratium fusus, Strain PA161109" /LENGTH=401 /DNA_ID=CAMNT_0013485599 /DNA_START=12 /DNA_END=1217 /DNA_ORIENTATION=+
MAVKEEALWRSMGDTTLLDDSGTPVSEDGEPIVTIRISGIPAHMSEPDFNCWFIFAPGFEQATLAPSKGKGVAQAGWARFDSFDAAQAAMQHLNGMRLTADQYAAGAVLSAELARRNFKPRNPLKSAAVGTIAPTIPIGTIPGIPTIVVSSSGTRRQEYDQPKHDSSSWSGGSNDWKSSSWKSGWAQPTSSAESEPGSESGSTLFIWKLHHENTEQELHQLCSEQCAGFERLKFVPPSNGKSGMCFVKFSSNDHASSALTILSNYALSSNPTEPLNIDFAKADLDTPKRTNMVVCPGVATTVVVREPKLNPPCDTMFIAGLASSVNDEELSAALCTLPGFERMKLVNEGTEKAMAFAQFIDVQSCSDGIQALHGNALPSAATTALNCEFSKNSLGKHNRLD